MKANILLENNLGLLLDIEKDPLACTVYDLDGNVISGGSGLNLYHTDITIVNNTNSQLGVAYMVGIEDNQINTNETQKIFNVGETGMITAYCAEDGCYAMCLVLSGGTPVPANVTVSDNVNCSYNIDDTVIYIFDQTDFNSSITLTCTV